MITIVLESPSHPGNIGAVARAMYTMGFFKLAMITPCEITEESLNRARKAHTIIDEAVIYDSEQALLEDFDILIGTSSRNRALHVPVFSSHDMPAHLINSNNRIGILFGHEKNGLSNELINLCQAIIEIPTHDGLSLNLSHAVQIICHQMSTFTQTSDLDISSVKDRQVFIQWLTEHLSKDFLKPHTMPRIQTIINKALLTESELNLLYSLFSENLKQ